VLVDLGCMNMAVALHIFDSQTRVCMPFWKHFLDQIAARCIQRHGALMGPNSEDFEDQELMAELAMFGAWTDWEDMQDPIWFPHAEALTQFMLTWS
jgi:hypothetical protein